MQSCFFKIVLFYFYRCDGEDDCGDGSDEDTLTTCADISCLSNQFQCDKTKCISSIFVCDGERDCADGTDEATEKCEIKFCSSNSNFLCKVSEFKRECDGFLILMLQSFNLEFSKLLG